MSKIKIAHKRTKTGKLMQRNTARWGGSTRREPKQRLERDGAAFTISWHGNQEKKEKKEKKTFTGKLTDKCLRVYIVCNQQTNEGRTDAMETRIETRFGAAVRSVERQYGRGLQARLVSAVGMESSNLSQIIKRDKRTSEEVRRKIYGECARLVPRYAIGYDGFLDFGGLIVSGVSEEAALEQVYAARYNLHIPRIHAHAVPSSGEAADIITDDLCQLIRASMARMDLDQRIELRAKVKLLLDDAGGEAISTSESASNHDNLL